MAIDPRIAQRQAELEAKKKQASKPANNYISASGGQGYVSEESRRKQNLTRLPVSQEPVVSAGGGSGYAGTGGGAPVVTAPAAATPVDNSSAFISVLEGMRADRDAEIARQREEYEKQQAEQKARFTDMKNTRDAQVNETYGNSKLNLDSAKQAADRDNYIAHMKGLKTMPQLSAVGGNGGYAQSLLSKQQVNYENNKSDIERTYLDDLRQLEADKNAALAANEEDYLNGIMGLETNAQDYLTRLEAMRTDDEALAAQMAGVIDKVSVPVNTAVQTATYTAPAASEYRYKLGGKSYNAQEFVTYLKNMGMSQAEIARYMQANGLSL